MAASIMFLRQTGILLLPLLVISTLACSGDADSNQRGNSERLIPAVEAVQTRSGSLPLTERLSGVVKAENQVELYPEVTAPIVEILVRNGEFVSAGQPLIRLRDTEFRERLNQARANLRITEAQAKQAEAELQQMRAELNRNERLAEQDLISPTELETVQTEAIAAEADAELARARVEQARATVEERQETLSRTVIRAPVAGAVGNRNAEVGMLVTPNTRLFTLGQLDSVRIEVVLTDRMLGYIEENQRAEILSNNLSGGILSAPVTRISPFLHPVSHSTVAEIDVANPDHDLKPGMFVTVDIFYGESEQATLIPLSALWENPNTATVGVYVSRDSLTGEPVAMLDDSQGGGLTDPVRFEFVPVEVIARGRMNAGISGVDKDRWVVTIGQDLLGADTGQARVRPVPWEWVERLQRMQREDLLDEIIRRRDSTPVDSALTGKDPDSSEGAA